MSKRRARRFKVAGAVIAGVLAVAALGVIVAVAVHKPDVDEVVLDKLTEIERLAPVNTSQLVLTPGVGQDNQWWSTLIAFMPSQVKLDDLLPTPDLGITHLGYTFSASDPALKLDQAYVRMLYVQTASDEHAKDVKRWLALSKGAAAGAFSTGIFGHTVVLATSDVNQTDALAKEGHGLDSSTAYRQDTAKREPGSLIWEDWGAYVKAAGASGGKPGEYSDFFYGATGFVKGSRWVGYSTSPKVGWGGTFQSGGMDSTLVSATNVESAIRSYDKVLTRDDKTGMFAVESGAGGFLERSFYVKHPDLKSRPTMGFAALAFAPESPGDTAFAFDPSMWLAGTARTGGAQPEGLSLFAYSVTGGKVHLKVTVNEAEAEHAGSAPVKTLPPSQRHAGYTPLPMRSSGPVHVPRPSPAP